MTKVEELLDREERFKPLAKYFKDILLEDIEDMTEDDLLSDISSHHRILMRAFINKHLQSEFQQRGRRPVPSQWKNEQQSEEDEQDPSTLDFKARLLSNAFRDFNICGKDLVSEIFEKHPEIKSNVSQIDRIDFSSNNLVDGDLEDVYKFITQFPYIKEFNLSFNRFFGARFDIQEKVDATIKDIIEHVDGIVIIVGNPLASAERPKFFAELKEEHYAKLIFIPENWFSGEHWRNIVPSQHHSKVQELHRAFYQTHR